MMTNGFQRSLRMGNGRVIIDARIRQRMKPLLDILLRAKRMYSCKHLCCREGVDKAPKAPKNRRVSLASSEKSGGDPSKLAPKPKAASNPRLKSDNLTKSERKRAIETVDLSQGGDMDGYSKTEPCEYEKIHALHESVCKGPPALTTPCSRNIPTFKRSKQFQIPSLSCNAEGSQARTESSSDYSWNWIDELPSSSELLGREKNKAEALKITKASQTSDMLGLEEVLSDVELESSRSNEKAARFQSPVNRIDQDEIDRRSCLEEQPSFTDQVSPPKSEVSLFCSTASHNGITTAPSTKRRILDLSETESTFQDGLRTKKRKISKQSIEQIPQPSTVDENEASEPVGEPNQIIQRTGRPRPEWVNEFDPEFIAEFADFVEFI